jgi:hypothetical protein
VRLFGRRKQTPDAPPTYWNSSVVERIERDAGVDRETATALWGEMLIFLDMVAAAKQFVSPPPSVDVAWHAFILHTRDYEAYCRERYGRIIHHQPTGKPDPHAYHRAYQARAATRTPVDNTIWPVPIATSAQSDDRPGQSGDFAAGAATIGGADFASQGATGGDFGDQPGGNSGDFALGAGDGPGGGDPGGASGGDFGGGDFGSGDSGGGDSGGSSCGGSSCGGGSS